MQQSFKTLQPLRFLAGFLLASTLFIACENKDTKTSEPAKEPSTEMKKDVTDSLPPLNTDSIDATKPETIKNKSAAQPK